MLAFIAALLLVVLPAQDRVTAGSLTLAHAQAMIGRSGRSEIDVLILASNVGEKADALLSVSSPASTDVAMRVDARSGPDTLVAAETAPLPIPTRTQMRERGQIVIQITLGDVDRAAFADGVPLTLVFREAGEVEVLASWGQSVVAPPED